MNNRVAITGMGIISSIGNGWMEFCNGIKNNKKCFSFLPNILSGEILMAHINNFSVEKYLHAPKAYLDRSSQFLFGAVTLALEDALLPSPPAETALIIGTQYGSLETSTIFYRDVLEKGPRFAKPFLFPHCYSNTGISLISIEYGLKGIHINLASGLNAGHEALFYAFHLVASGKTSIAIAGGFDAISHPIIYGLRAKKLRGDLSDDFVPGEGAGIFIIENYEYAKARNAPIKAFITAAEIGSTPERAIEATNCADKVDCIITSANGIQEIDETEYSAISKIYGNLQKPVPQLFNTKKLIGETFAASGPLNTATGVYFLNANTNKNGIILANSTDIAGNSICLALNK